MRAKQIGKLLIACAIGVMFSISLMAMHKGGQTWRRHIPEGFRATTAGKVVPTYSSEAELRAIVGRNPDLAQQLEALAHEGANLSGISGSDEAIIRGAPAAHPPVITHNPVPEAAIRAATDALARLRADLVPGVDYANWQAAVEHEREGLANALAAATTATNDPANKPEVEHLITDLRTLHDSPNPGPAHGGGGGGGGGGHAANIAVAATDFGAEFGALTDVTYPAWRGRVEAEHGPLATAIHDHADAPNIGAAQARLAVLVDLLARPAPAARHDAPAFDAEAFKGRVQAFIQRVIAYSTKPNDGTKKAERAALEGELATLVHDAEGTPAADAVAAISIPASAKTTAYAPKGRLAAYLH